MNEMHCYNQNCINAIALRNCAHEEQDCPKRELYPALLVRDENGDLESYYCSRECKAKVVMVDYDVKQKPRTTQEMKYRLQLMKQEFFDKQKGQKNLL